MWWPSNAGSLIVTLGVVRVDDYDAIMRMIIETIMKTVIVGMTRIEHNRRSASGVAFTITAMVIHVDYGSSVLHNFQLYFHFLTARCATVKHGTRKI